VPIGFFSCFCCGCLQY